MDWSQTHSSRKILLVVTVGGFTHAAPVLEIGRVLAERGHTIEFATLDGQESWIKPEIYGFVTEIHLLGPGPTAEQLDAHYRRMQAWNVRKGIEPLFISKRMFDTFWPQTYHGLKKIIAFSPPDFIVADFLVDAANDMLVEYKIPIAIVCPNWPPLQIPCSYIPGQPGFQLPGTLTSEGASMWLRAKNEMLILSGLPTIMSLFKCTRKMRSKNGVNYPVHKPKKPDYLLFVNSFIGLEIPRDLPPTCAAVGPLLSPTWPSLDTEYEAFMTKHTSVLYIALGTHIVLPHQDIIKIITGVLRLIEEDLLDGVIWAIPKTGRHDIDVNETINIRTWNQALNIRLADLLANKHPDWLFSFFAPQRAILEHKSTKIYFTHGGGSSANEALYHGKPILSMGIFFDQISNSARLVAGGVAESLDKFSFTSDEVYAKAKEILTCEEGESYQRDVLRLQRIAHIASRRKEYAADLVEEMMYDNELRIDRYGRELRPMHLQTADSRMSVFKAKNWDMYAVCGLSLTVFVGSMGLGGIYLWRYRGSLMGQAMSIVVRGWRFMYAALNR